VQINSKTGYALCKLIKRQAAIGVAVQMLQHIDEILIGTYHLLEATQQTRQNERNRGDTCCTIDSLFRVRSLMRLIRAVSLLLIEESAQALRCLFCSSQKTCIHGKDEN
jgi:hypothetical protein